MSTLLLLFANNLLPIFLAAGTGYLLSKILNLEARSLSRVVFYIFSPCLIFTLLTQSQLNGEDVMRMTGFTIVQMMALGLLTWIVGRALKLERGLFVAVMLTALFGNTGNFGLSFTLFAFGETALAHASVFFVVSAILIYTVGVFIASLGKSGIRQALAGMFKLPVLYAVALALIFMRFDWQFPLFLDRTISTLSDAAIPVMLVLLGLQLQQAKWTGHLGALALSNGMRLLVSPALALGLSALFALQGPAQQAGISETAMPTAVMVTVLATEFDVEPAFATLVVFSSTILSPLTLTPLIAYLGS